MSPVNVTLSRLDGLFIARLAEQAERYHDVIAQIKSIVHSTNAQLTSDERNLLSIAYKNITASFRTSWRTIDTLQRNTVHHSTWQQRQLMQRQKERIEQDLIDTCKDVVELLERFLIPAANPGEEKVFYCKMRGDYYRYLAEMSRSQTHEQYAATSLDAYKFAYKHALNTLDPAHPTRLGLALNFAVYYHDIRQSPERACFLAKHAFDEAMAVVTDVSVHPQSLEDSLTILHLLKDDLLLWAGEMTVESK
ncbi:14-3-3-like protein [Laetiporus sulphureus 93-53]|uniref:14-3-3-like protein n=1 Tax=Laetiporus sulphureus 93-53 TaxID=1314785 RepID=A0A165IHQ3_9APHY|nr:14-3-3-like protein [Laetiporus sulphureus 93-53]KZT13089.1 14-3-3-like protein [Laetiporus sulphureus 93-53]